MLKAFLQSGVGGACAILAGWWMRQAWGWTLDENIQTAFASLFTALFITADWIVCALAVLVLPASVITKFQSVTAKTQADAKQAQP